MRRLLPALLAALLLLPAAGGDESALPDRRPKPPTLTGKAKRRIEDVYGQWFAAADADRAALLAELREIGPLADRYAKEFARLAFRLAQDGVKVTDDSEQTFGHPDFPGTFRIYGARKGKRKGLLVGLHGGGQGVGDGAESAQKWQSATGQDLICVFPTVIEKVGTAWNQPREENYVLALVEAVKRTYPIDTNRVYLAGHSMGGYGTWSIGGHHADLFAAITPNAGGIFVTAGPDRKILGIAGGILPNLRNTPVYFTHGANDAQVSVEPDRLAAKELAKLKEADPEGYEYVYKEYPDIGHGLPPDGTTPIIKWLAAHTRDPRPKKVVWEAGVAGKRTFYWLRREDPSRGGVVTAVRAGNTIEVATAGNADGISVLLGETDVDLEEPVTVTLNGREVFRDYVHPRADVILESVAARNDPEMWFTVRIDL